MDALRSGADRRHRLWFSVLPLVLVCAGLIAIPSAAHAVSGPLTWEQEAPAQSPPGISGAASAYDADTGEVVLFGGSKVSAGFSAETWTYDGTTWTKRSPAASPPAREVSSMVYDAAHKVIVLFGGFSPAANPTTGYVADTWTWDGTTWTRRFPATSPPARGYASMAYDSTDGNVVLFGGAFNGNPTYSDTWTWDGTTWTQRSSVTHPALRAGAAMSDDPAHGNVVLFGGYAQTGPGGETIVQFSDTWIWSGGSWTEVHPTTHPPGVNRATADFDAGAGNVLLFGGSSASGLSADTWIWDGTTWTLQHPDVSPPARGGASMAFDAGIDKMVLFGGFGGGVVVFDDTWTWDAPGSEFIVPGVGTVTEGNSGTVAVQVPVTLTNPSSATVTAHWETAFVAGAPAGQADPATDYTPASGTVTFAPGATTASVSIAVKGDTLVEPDEYVVVEFSAPVNATMGGFFGLGFVGITNDDHATVVPGVGSVAEGDSGTVAVLVPVALSNPSTQTVTAHWATGFAAGAPAGQADPATDYTPASGTVTFAPGQTSAMVTVLVKGDTLVEPDEYIVVFFTSPVNAQLGGFWGLGFGQILDDD